MNFVQLKVSDGSWDTLQREWRAQCDEFGEDFDSYAPSVFSVLEPLAAETNENAWVYGLELNGQYVAMCQLNRARLPNYDGYVLRVRYMTFSPRLDFGDSTTGEYSKALGQLFVRVYVVSLAERESQHIKFHLRSPADRVFFDNVATRLHETRKFGVVALRGMWLEVTHE